MEALELLGVSYHVGGSLASSVYGRPRSTVDVDVVAELRLEHVDGFIEQLRDDYYVEQTSIRAAIGSRGSFNVIHLDTMVKVDIFVPDDRLFEQQEMRRARPRTLDIATDARTFFVKSPEDSVLRKLLWYRAGHEASEQQWNDVVGVLKVQAGRLDLQYLDHWASEIGMSDLLQRALGDAEL